MTFQECFRLGDTIMKKHECLTIERSVWAGVLKALAKDATGQGATDWPGKTPAQANKEPLKLKKVA